MKRALAALCLFAGVALAANPAKVSLLDLSRNLQTLEQYRGRVVILNFWATWCVPLPRGNAGAGRYPEPLCFARRGCCRCFRR